MAKQYTLAIEKDDEGWLIAEVLELPGCHTQARTMEELRERAKEAITAYLADQPERSTEFVGVQHITV